MKKVSLLDLFLSLSIEEQSELIEASVAYARTIAEPYTMEFYEAKKQKLIALVKSKFSQFFA